MIPEINRAIYNLSPLHEGKYASALTWTSMLARGLILLALVTYAGSSLEPAEATVFLMMLSILSLQGALDFGFIPTFIRIIAYVNGEKNKSEVMAPIAGFNYSNVDIYDILVAFSWIYRRLTWIFLLLVSVIGTAALYSPINLMDDPAMGWSTWLMTLIGSLFLFSNSRYAAILTGYNQISLQRLIELIVNIPLLLMISLGVILEIDFSLMMIFIALGYAFLFFVTKANVDRLVYARAPTNMPLPNYYLVQTIFQSAWRSGLGVIMTMGTITGSGLIIAQLVDPLASSTYLMAQRLIIAIGGYCYVPFQVVIPTLASLYAAGDTLRLQKIARRARQQVSLLVVLIGGCVLFVTELLLPEIGFEFRFTSTQIWLVMLMYMLIERSGATNIQLQSVNNEIKWHISNGVSGLIMLLSMPLLISWYGVLGLPLTFLFGYLSFFYPYSIYRRFYAFRTINIIEEVSVVLIPFILLVGCSFLLVE